MQAELCTIARRGRTIKNPYRGATPCDKVDAYCRFWRLPDDPAHSVDRGPRPPGDDPAWELGEHPDDPISDQLAYARRRQADRDVAARQEAERRLRTCCHFPDFHHPVLPETPHAP